MREDLGKIREIIYSGAAALDKPEEESLLSSLNDTLKAFIKEEQNSADSLEIITDIFETIYSGGLGDIFAERIDPDSFFHFGRKLAAIRNIENFHILEQLISEYLNLFRLSKFLIRIYNDRRWDKLIEDLLTAARYNVNSLFRDRLKYYGSKVLFRAPEGNSDIIYTWEEVAKQVQLIQKSLYVLAEKDSERKIIFLTENSVRMAFLDIACLTGGFVNIMVPANSVPQHVEYIINQVECPIIFVSNEKQLTKVLGVSKSLKCVKKIVLLYGKSADEGVISWDKFMEPSREKEQAEFHLPNPAPDSLATIMYTSGTTGEPKGIMFTHMNIVYKRFCRAMALPDIDDKDIYLAYLPLFHTFGRYLELMGAIYWGAEYIFMENPAVETMIRNMKKYHPSIFISIPKKWIQLYELITSQVDIEIEDEEIIREKVKEATGGKLKWGLSAAGFLHPEIFLFFRKYGVTLMSGFGMTEATGGITMTPPEFYYPNSLGKALPGIEIKLSDDGELLIKGSYVMKGYYGREKHKTFSPDGWFPTGDIMVMDENGFIEIIDRKKEIYKNVRGETIAPQKIENYFRDIEFIKQVFLVGDHRAFNTILIYPDYENASEKFRKMDQSRLNDYFSSVIVTVNNFLAPYERIVDYRIIHRQFTPDKGEVTPKGTYKRRIIEKNFDEEISSMYEKNHTDLYIEETEVRVPNWFLREKGCLSRDILAVKNEITIPKLKKSLMIKKLEGADKTWQIGSYHYKTEKWYIDLQQLLISPSLWCGNKELFDFAGESILLWDRHSGKDNGFEIVGRDWSGALPRSAASRMKKLVASSENSVAGLHTALQLIQSPDKEQGRLGISYIDYCLADNTLPIYSVAFGFLSLPFFVSDTGVLKEYFRLAVKAGYCVGDILTGFIKYDKNILDDPLINFIIEKNKGHDCVKAIEAAIRREFAFTGPKSDINKIPVVSLFRLLSFYGYKHPTTYEYIRQIFVKYQLNEEIEGIAEIAKEYRQLMKEGFRNWLGENEQISVDLETGDEYTWKDVIITEEDMPEADKNRIIDAITNTSILREAIFLFSKGKLIRLNNILPGGVWISFLRQYHDKTVYRVSIQTRFQGSFDIVLNLNNNLAEERLTNEICWLILAGSRHFVEELVEDFGGYWDKYSMWSGKFVPGDTVDRYLQRIFRKRDENSLERTKHLWPFFVWNAAASYMNFWKLTGYTLKLASICPENYIIPTHDYHTGTKVLSFSERIEFSSLKDLIDTFINRFIKDTEEKYPFLKYDGIYYFLFAGVLNTEGENRGIELLEEYKEEIAHLKQIAYYRNIHNLLIRFINHIREKGFKPKQLFFAVKRFHRWHLLNGNAQYDAQAEMLGDLYNMYHLPELENSYKATRTRFFLETVFFESSAEVKKELERIITRQQREPLDKEELVEELTSLKLNFPLNEREEYFLTRLSYPHLKPSDTAELVKIRESGAPETNLIVQYEDYDGSPFVIRKPVSPKEISKLHQLFLDASLLVSFRPDHHFLVALSERGFIIGGLFYKWIDESTVYMDKIVVSNRYRRKGISDRLMNELFNRLRSENVKHLTTGFLRPEYFYRFDFKVERKYSGLVKEL